MLRSAPIAWIWTAILALLSAGRHATAQPSDMLPEFLSPDYKEPAILRNLVASPASALSPETLRDVLARWKAGNDAGRRVLEERLGNDPDAALREVSRLRLNGDAFGSQSLEYQILQRKLMGYKWLEQLKSGSFAVRADAWAKLDQYRQVLDEVFESSQNSANAEIRLACIRYTLEIRGRGFLGIQTSSGITRRQMNPMPINEKCYFQGPGCWISNTVHEMPAEIAGLQSNDMVVRMNNIDVGSYEDLVKSVAVLGAHRDVICTVIRSEPAAVNNVNAVGYGWEFVDRVQWFKLKLAPHFRDVPKR